jgi:hypothetical protein
MQLFSHAHRPVHLGPYPAEKAGAHRYRSCGRVWLRWPRGSISDRVGREQVGRYLLGVIASHWLIML